MGLPTSGQISTEMVNRELGRAPNTPVSFNDPAVRNLIKRLTGQVIMPTHFYGASQKIEVSYAVYVGSKEYPTKQKGVTNQLKGFLTHYENPGKGNPRGKVVTVGNINGTHYRGYRIREVSTVRNNQGQILGNKIAIYGHHALEFFDYAEAPGFRWSAVSAQHGHRDSGASNSEYKNYTEWYWPGSGMDMIGAGSSRIIKLERRA